MSGSQWSPMGPGHSGHEFDWITAPPLRELNERQLEQAKTLMEGAVRRYDTHDDDYEEDWNDRLTDTLNMIDSLSNSDLNLSYWVLGVPVGIICLSDHDPTYISTIVTHPGTADAGGILMEAAADYSEARGHHGCLTLWSLNKKSTHAYRAMGFVKLDGNYDGSGKMTLDPRTLDYWTHVDGRWRVAKYVGGSYFRTRKPLPPLPGGRS